MSEVELLMKRCQRGVGGFGALNEAHDIMAECYGMLGKIDSENKRMREALQSIYDQCPNPDLSHIDYRVHACRFAEQALSPKP